VSTTVEHERVPPAVVVGVTVAVALLHLWVSSPIDHPSVVFDEAGYLGNARWLAGAGAGWEMPWSPRYAVGYPLLLAPLTRIFPDPDLQWRAVQALNAVLLAMVLPLLYLVGRKVAGASPRTSLLAATVGAVVPAALLAGVSAIAENVVLPLVPLAVLAAWALCRSGPGWTRLAFGPVIVALYAAHPRFVVALPVGAAVLAWVAWRRLAPPMVLAVNAGVLVVGSVASFMLSAALVSARWDQVESLEGGPGDLLRLLTSRGGAAELLWTAVGQAWYLTVGSLGLVVIGVVVAVRRLRSASSSVRRDGPASGDAEARAVAMATLLALAVGVFVLSVVFFAQNQFRDDHLVYGRHNDSFTPVWVLLALVGLAGATRRQVLQVAAGAAAVVVTLFVVLVATRETDAFGGRYAPFAVPALVSSVEQGVAAVFWRSTGAALVGLLVVTLVAVSVASAWRPWVLAAPLVAVAVWSGLAAVHATEFFQGWSYAGWTAAEEVERLDVDAIEIDGRIAAGFPALAYPFYLPDVRVTTYESELGEVPAGPYVLASTTDEHLTAIGARIVLLDLSLFYPDAGLPDGVALWVQPGPELDRLEAEGAVLPAGFPTGLPSAARQGALELVDLPDEVEVRAGETLAFTVRGRHAGSGSPWPDYASYGNDARVRIVADVQALPAEDERQPRVVGELPRWVRPGDGFTAEVEVAAVDERQEPLPPGRYRVSLGVGQGDPEWSDFSEAAAFDLVVTG
jgi:hypothetical protein